MRSLESCLIPDRSRHWELIKSYFNRIFCREAQCKEVTLSHGNVYRCVAFSCRMLGSRLPAYITVRKVRYGPFRNVLLLNEHHFPRQTSTYKGLQIRWDWSPKGILLPERVARYSAWMVSYSNKDIGLLDRWIIDPRKFLYTRVFISIRSSLLLVPGNFFDHFAQDGLIIIHTSLFAKIQ